MIRDDPSFVASELQPTMVPEPVANYHCEIGENPLWDDRRQILWWTDIPQGKLFQFSPSKNKHTCVAHLQQPIGGFVFEEDGSLLLFQANRISRLRSDLLLETLREGIDPDMERFNDVIVSPQGRIFAGTIGISQQNGGLYRIDLEGNISCLFKGTGCSNGMGFSPDRRSFYWTCSTTRKIFRFAYDSKADSFIREGTLIHVPDSQGIPDGLTIDSDGFLWSAQWGGDAVIKYSPSGQVIDRVRVPVAKVSSVTFGGKDLDEIYITTAGGRNENTSDGSLYRVKSNSRGQLPFRSKVLF
jgi:D-xylono/L-arabinono-1,4-lactonase